MSQIDSNIKDDFQVVLLLSCFVGHPVCTSDERCTTVRYVFLKMYSKNDVIQMCTPDVFLITDVAG